MLKSARLSKFLLPTLRQMPADADTVSAKLMLRAGMIRKVASGIYDWLPMGLIVLKKVEQIVREEMDAAGGQEVWLPVIQPKGLWVETGRWAVYGKELLRIADRKGSEFCFAPTAEEIITDLVRREVRSWRQLPLMLYQFGLKFRDEIRPRFGVMRAREFYMKDAYSFHADAGEFSVYYQRLFEAYGRIFKRCGLQFRPVEAVSGAIGGDTSHEFMVLAEAGEETIVTCAACSYAANLERAESAAESIPAANHADLLPLMEVPTPGVWTVEGVSELLRAPKSKFIKTMFYDADGRPVVALLRGDHELNEEKLTRALKCRALRKSQDAEYRDIAKCEVGFAGPAGLKERSGRADLLIMADHAVRSVINGISGANKNGMHLSNINLDRDYRPDAFADIRVSAPEDLCPRCRSRLNFSKGIEVGHTFQLGTKYSEKLGAVYLDESQKPHPIIMGCYGIGVSRVVAAAIEQCHDADGILWPEPLAPFGEHLICVETDDAEVLAKADALFEQLQSLGLSVLYDDRDERPGVKFKDADLIGLPRRLTVSRRTLQQQSVEFKRRNSAKSELWKLSDLPQKLQELTAPI